MLSAQSSLAFPLQDFPIGQEKRQRNNPLPDPVLAMALRAVAYTGMRYEYKSAHTDSPCKFVFVHMGASALDRIIPNRLYARHS